MRSCDELADTEPMAAARASTESDWPPTPPEPDTAEQPTVDPTPPRRRAAVYRAVTRPTTSD